MKGLETGDDFVCRSITGCAPSDVRGLCTWLTINNHGHTFYGYHIEDARAVYSRLEQRDLYTETSVQVLGIRLRYLKEQALKNRRGRSAWTGIQR